MIKNTIYFTETIAERFAYLLTVVFTRIYSIFCCEV